MAILVDGRNTQSNNFSQDVGGVLTVFITSSVFWPARVPQRPDVCGHTAFGSAGWVRERSTCRTDQHAVRCLARLRTSPNNGALVPREGRTRGLPTRLAVV